MIYLVSRLRNIRRTVKVDKALKLFTNLRKMERSQTQDHSVRLD